MFLIVGFGKTGRSVENWCIRHGHAFSTFDDKSPDAQIHVLQDIPWEDISWVIPSPGLPFIAPHIHPVLQKAIDLNLPLKSDIDLFFEEITKRALNVRLVGITGTNGKSTTTALVGHILKHAHHPVHIGGNIGVPVLDLDLEMDHTYILELSSYQLAMSSPLLLHVAALLNITPDHLDWHGNMDHYIASKARIFEKAEISLCGQTDDLTQQIFETLRSPKEIISRDQAQVWHTHKTLKGVHNLQNIAMAQAICRHLGLSEGNIEKGIESFQGLPHRIEIVVQKEHVLFVNDSKATNAQATEKALLSFQDQDIYWILGGLPKEGGIEMLSPYFPTIKKAYLIGQAAEAFAKTLSTHVEIVLSATLEKAVQQAQKDACENLHPSVVLLSPACASFDQFKNFEERGECFKRLCIG